MALSYAKVSNDGAVGPLATRSEAVAEHGMVATSHGLATQVGVDILKQGGSAVDAAIAANAAIGLMEPMSNGIGGDLFAIVWDPKTKRLHGLNGSGRSPRSLTKQAFAEKSVSGAIPMMGPLSISVPGCVDGWFALHGRFGRLSIEEILRPAIRYANEGHPVPEVIANMWAREVSNRSDQRDLMPGFMETFAREGRAPSKGDIWMNAALGSTLATIAKEGRDAFYKGELARTMDACLKKAGAFLSYEDLSEHAGEWVDPVSANYRGWDVWELPPNGQGIAALQILNLLEGLDLGESGFGSRDHLHAFIEAKKLAYEDRAKFYGDPDFGKQPIEKLISKKYAEERRRLIDREKAGLQYPPGQLEHGDTIYLCAADTDGMMVSLIQSNFLGFGSGVCVPELGFGFQNRGALFSLEEGHANGYEPNKRPFNTIIPGFVTKNGLPLLAFGVMGGAMQPQGHAQVIMNMKDFGMNLQEAGDAPRVHHSGSTEPFGADGSMVDGGTVLYEDGFPSETIRDLKRMGHAMKIGETEIFGGYQAIYRNPSNGVYYGASESRKDGHAAGY